MRGIGHNWEELEKLSSFIMLIKTSEERGLTFREVYQLLGLRCKTSHTARGMAKRGQIRSIQINGRVTRYSFNSVMQLLGAGEQSEENVDAC